MAEYRYNISTTAGKAGDKVTQTGERLQQLIKAGFVREVKIVEPTETKSKPKRKPKAKSDE